MTSGRQERMAWGLLDGPMMDVSKYGNTGALADAEPCYSQGLGLVLTLLASAPTQGQSLHDGGIVGTRLWPSFASPPGFHRQTVRKRYRRRRRRGAIIQQVWYVR